jgi:predicted GTPase
MRAKLVRRYWREGLLAFLYLLPWLSLGVLGVLWLFQEGHLLPWAIALAVTALLALPLRYSIKRRTMNKTRGLARGGLGPENAWVERELDAWRAVEAIADETAPLGLTDQQEVAGLVRHVALTVARHLRPSASDPLAAVTLPEALLFTERLSRDLRRMILQHVPGVRQVRLSHLRWVHGTYRKWSPVISLLDRARRLSRFGFNPQAAVLRELGDFIVGHVGGKVSMALRTELTQGLILETGRAVIDLYSGRLTMSADEIAVAAEEDISAVEPEEVPVRILVAGQVNAGKSSLLNALGEEVISAASVLPTTRGFREYLLEVDGRPTVVMRDAPGLHGAAGEVERLVEEAARADLILWVANVTQAARAPDVVALEALRKAAASRLDRQPAPILLALTHVDQLRPAGEWSPPYDISNPVSPKARSISAASATVAATLAFPPEDLIAIALRPGAEAYNIDALWAALQRSLPKARYAQLDRLRLKTGWKRNLSEAYDAALRSGRIVARAALGYAASALEQREDKGKS